MQYGYYSFFCYKSKNIYSSKLPAFNFICSILLLIEDYSFEITKFACFFFYGLLFVSDVRKSIIT
jgi:hypothetical protein